ncbi:MAG TPA: phosphatase PAP2 family protein [Candidatus Omnitrophota bacterium]|nr:phosphatase PAP2 family protein [Candidatus Omnitrophota bacterium]
MNSSFYWDTRLFLDLNRHAGTWFDYLLGWPTHLGEAYFFLPIVFLLLLIWDSKNILPRFTKIALCVIIAGIVNSLLKDFVDRPRPWSFFYQAIDQGLVNVTYLFAMDTAESFPSGHTTAVFALAAALHQFYGKKVLWVYLFAAWIGVSRVFCGAHFPSDVLAGAVVGIVSAKILFWVFPIIEGKLLSKLPRK